MIYNGTELIETIVLPKSVRTHINIMELYILYIAFKWISNISNYHQYIKNSLGVSIVSDSQNCLKLISNKTTTIDDVCIHIHEDIIAHFQLIKALLLPDNFIKIFWVHSHAQESKLNDAVDD